jgi:hypothetical protein
MDIIITGNLYVYYIRNVYELNKILGKEIIIDINRSDNILIDGLKRLNKINKNKIFINTNDIKIPVKIYENKYTCNVEFKFNAIQNNIELNKLDILEYDKIIKKNKLIDNNFRLQNYSTGKNKTFKQIMSIITN